MTTLTNAEYGCEIEELAAGIWEEALTQAEGNTEEVEQLAYELIHDWVDSHQWVVYTVYHRDVLTFTENEGAYKDVYGNDDLGSIVREGGLDKLNTIMVYFAMQADILEALHEYRED